LRVDRSYLVLNHRDPGIDRLGAARGPAGPAAAAAIMPSATIAAPIGASRREAVRMSNWCRFNDRSALEMGTLIES
jgi:hypothetical protein